MGTRGRGEANCHTVWVPLTTLSKRKDGASLSSSATRHLYAVTGVSWSAKMRSYMGTRLPLLAASWKAA